MIWQNRFLCLQHGLAKPFRPLTGKVVLVQHDSPAASLHLDPLQRERLRAGVWINDVLYRAYICCVIWLFSCWSELTAKGDLKIKKMKRNPIYWLLLLHLNLAIFYNLRIHYGISGLITADNQQLVEANSNYPYDTYFQLSPLIYGSDSSYSLPHLHRPL